MRKKSVKIPGILRTLRSIYLFILDIMFPRRCPVCDNYTPFMELVCPDCLVKLQYVTPPRCMRCGKKLIEEQREYCHDCSICTHKFIQGRALYDYPSVAESLYRFKYEKRQEYAQFYGHQMSIYLEDVIRDWKPDALIPVPIHFTRKHVRGYNQAYLLAWEIGWRLDIPVYGDLLKRCKKTVPQKELDKQERQNNLKKAFKLGRNDVKLESAIIIDDIYTTGATIDACAEVLREAGIEKIYFLSMAIGKGI